MDTNVAVRMVGITKDFGKGLANDNITLEIYKGEILSLLGENGSGKTNINTRFAIFPLIFFKLTLFIHYYIVTILSSFCFATNIQRLHLSYICFRAKKPNV